MSARAIPGDPEYPKDVTVEDIAELSLRLDGALNELEGVDDNAIALAGVVSVLKLGGEAANWRESQELKELAESLLDKATVVFENVLRITGVSVDVEPEPEPVEDEVVPEGGVDGEEAASMPALEVTLPPQLGNESPESRKRLLGAKIFALNEQELKQVRTVTEPLTVSLCDEGKGLLFAPPAGRVKIADKLPEVVIRGINMYNRLLLAGVQEFKKSDVDELFGPEGGFTNMIGVVAKTNDVFVKQLGLPELFSSNGLPRAQARYTPTGAVLITG